MQTCIDDLRSKLVFEEKRRSQIETHIKTLESELAQSLATTSQYQQLLAAALKIHLQTITPSVPLIEELPILPVSSDSGSGNKRSEVKKAMRPLSTGISPVPSPSCFKVCAGKALHVLLRPNVDVDQFFETAHIVGLRFQTLVAHGLSFLDLQYKLSTLCGNDCLWFARQPEQEQLFVNFAYPRTLKCPEIHEIITLPGLTTFHDRVDRPKLKGISACSHHDTKLGRAAHCARADVDELRVWIENYMSRGADTVKVLTKLNNGQAWTTLTINILDTESCRNTRFTDGRRIFTEVSIRQYEFTMP